MSGDVPSAAATCERVRVVHGLLPVPPPAARGAADLPAEAERGRNGPARDWSTRSAPHLRPWMPRWAYPSTSQLPATTETRSLDEAFRRGRLEDAVTELLGQLCCPPRLCLVVEDAQLMDDASADLLGGWSSGSRPTDGCSW